MLAHYFAATLSAREGIPPRTLTPDALERLGGLDWPGNVRELRNTVERLLILAPESQISARDIDRLAGQRAMDDAGLATLTQCKTFEEFKDEYRDKLKAAFYPDGFPPGADLDRVRA